ncbi:hypothetical protein [Pseudarthrobacter sp. B4EP4b]|uniref:hypothetical protein n=1 Tax=Pseudarthrobacter sp. B4EP4b TaxID=2590664 RepID=UPI00114ED2C3|nr:hypothetical protein [Pseudarthrobacter sp. B4EP4b]
MHHSPGAALLVFSLADPIIQLLPWYAAVYLLIGACIFGPTRKVPSARQAMAYLLPGALLVVLALAGLGFWAGGWLVGLWVLGLVVFTFNGINPMPSLGLLLLPLILLVRLASLSTGPDHCRRQ